MDAIMSKKRNGGNWTEARYRSFIISNLRKAHSKWGPKNECKKQARISRGMYRCAECNTVGPATLPPKPGNKLRRNNAVVDHIEPVIDPAVGFVDWDTYVSRMFCELDNYQLLCWDCHDKKTKEERAIATERKRNERN